MTILDRYSPAFTLAPPSGLVAGLGGVEAGFGGCLCVALPIPRGGALLGRGEEGGGLEAGPEGLALGGEGLDGIEVGAQLQALVGREPGRQCLGRARDEGEDRLAPQRAVGSVRCGRTVMHAQRDLHSRRPAI